MYSSVVICLMIGIFCLALGKEEVPLEPDRAVAYRTSVQFSFFARVLGEPMVAER